MDSGLREGYSTADDPVGDGIVGFDSVFDTVRQEREEIDTDQVLHTIHRKHIGHEGTIARRIGHYETYGSPRAVRFAAQQHFVESLRHDYPTDGTDSTGRIGHDRAASEIDIAVGGSQITHKDLQVLPVAGVIAMVLGTDIGHIKRLTHSLLRPFHIRCRRHVSAVETGVSIVGSEHGITLHKRIGEELVAPFLLTGDLLGSELVRHPVGEVPIRIVTDPVTGMGDTLLLLPRGAERDFIIEGSRYIGCASRLVGPDRLRGSTDNVSLTKLRYDNQCRTSDSTYDTDEHNLRTLFGHKSSVLNKPVPWQYIFHL